MKSILKFTLNPDNSLAFIEETPLFRGQVGTAEYRLRAENWLRTDLAFISFRRSDGKETSQIMPLNAERDGWEYLSNGWETLYEGELKVSFILRRYSGVDPSRVIATAASEQISVTVHPSGEYTPLEYPTNADILYERMNEQDIRITTEAERLDGRIDTEAERLDGRIDTEAERLDGMIGAVSESLNERITGETGRLDGRIDGEAGRLDGEIAARTEADAEIRQDLLSTVREITYDHATHVMTVHNNDDTTLEVDLPIEELFSAVSYDADAKEIVLTTQEGAEIRISVADLVDEYTGSTGEQINVTVGTGNVIGAVLKDGSVGAEKLAAALMTLINGKISDIPDATATVKGKATLGATGGAATYESVQGKQDKAPIDGVVYGLQNGGLIDLADAGIGGGGSGTTVDDTEPVRFRTLEGVDGEKYFMGNKFEDEKVRVSFLYSLSVIWELRTTTRYYYKGDGVLEYPGGTGDVSGFVNHSPDLTFQGWTHGLNDLSGIRNDINAGATYVPADGKTHAYIYITAASGLTVQLFFNKSDTSELTVDWGDGAQNTNSGSGNQSLSHTYAAYGDYEITLAITSGAGTYTFGNGSDSTAFIGGNTQAVRNALVSVFIGNNITTIGGYAFYGCAALKNVTVPNSVTAIGGYAFYGCAALEYATVPNSVTTIGGYAFYDCDALEFLVIGNSVTTIGERAFGSCRVLNKVVIPNSVTAIGDYAFRGCSALASVTIGNSVTTIGGNAFSYCRLLADLVIPNSVTAIGDWAFSYCAALTSAVIPNSVTAIGDYAFGNCSALASVTIGNSVTTIGDYAFSDNPSLTELIFYKSTPPNHHGLSSSGGFTTKIYVPDQSVDAYKAKWKAYAKYIYPISKLRKGGYIEVVNEADNVKGGVEMYGTTPQMYKESIDETAEGAYRVAAEIRDDGLYVVKGFGESETAGKVAESADVEAVQAGVAALQTDLATAQTDLATAQSDIAALNAKKAVVYDGQSLTYTDLYDLDTDARRIATDGYVDKRIADAKVTTFTHEAEWEAATLADLPVEGVSFGDVWKTTDDDKEYYWDGDEWNEFAPAVDLSGYFTKSETESLLADKVDAEEGKGLSSNDYTTAEKEKLSGLDAASYATAAQGALAATAVQPDAIPLATATAVGGIKANAADENDVTAVNIDENGFLKTSAREGKSAYGVAVENGFTGTEEEWLESLRAQPGKNLAKLTQGTDYILEGYNSGSSATWQDTAIKLQTGGGVSERVFFLKMTFSGSTGNQGQQKNTVLNFTAWYATVPDAGYTPKVITGSVAYDGGAAVDIPVTLNYAGVIDAVTVYVNLNQYLYPPTIQAEVYELTGRGVAPSITPSPFNAGEIYKLHIEIPGQPPYDTENLMGKTGTGLKGDRGSPAVMEAVTVTAEDFNGGKVVIPYTTDAEAAGLVHRVGATSNIVAFRQIWDAGAEAWKTAIITADNVTVKEDGTVTVTDTPFDGKILLSSGSQYAEGGGGDTGAKHTFLTEGTDYVINDAPLSELNLEGILAQLGLETLPIITFPNDTDECPMYAAHIYGHFDGGESATVVNFTFKKVTLDEGGYAFCDDDISVFTGVYGTAFYINSGGYAGWSYLAMGSDGGGAFIRDNIEIIKI